MKLAALFARVIAATVSLLYLVFFLPHFRGLNAEHFQNGWSLAGMAIALLWVPLLVFQRKIQRASGAYVYLFSFVPIILIVTFFGLLLKATTTIH